MNEKIKINVLGDTHGLPFWKELIDKNAVNVFLGDYLDAKIAEFRSTQMRNFLEILQYKQDNPEKVKLLLANHDLPYMFLGKYGYNIDVNADAINNHTIFQANKHLFDGVAYAIGNYLITHAGVTKQWYDRFIGDYNGESATELAEKINEKYKYYISINGIPEDEYDEFVSMHKAYNGVGGNHHGDAKFEYCIEHLPIIPVETRLKYKEKE